ncbi:MAG: hypothetical protein ACFUZC_04545 [Chthoniobacteraceae bacterium]
MKLILSISVIAALGCTGLQAAQAAQIRCDGVLGNSGEQGTTLVRFASKPASGLGVVADEAGSLWDRAGDGVLNRYARDGRLLASYPLPPNGGCRTDRITCLEGRLLLSIAGKLYTLALDSAPGTAPTALNVAADQLSFNSVNGKVAIATTSKQPSEPNKRLWMASLFDPARNEVKPLLEIPANSEIALSPEGGLLVRTSGKMQLFQNAALVKEGWPRPTPGDRIQWIDGYWYGSRGHGTIQRFNGEFESDPGVVIGGASGSFIGHVDGNTEMEVCQGLAKINGNLFAASGINGILHLLRWDEEQKAFFIVRRIGAVQDCTGLGLNRKGQVWFYSGYWNWSDNPDTPLRDCASAAPIAGNGNIGQVVMLPNDEFVAPLGRSRSQFLTGPFGWKLKYNQVNEPLAKTGLLNGSVVYPGEKNQPILLAINAAGRGESYKIDGAGNLAALGAVTLNTTIPVSRWTSLALENGDVLLGAADGFVIELNRDGDNWKEVRRWNSWKGTAPSSFGKYISIAADAEKLWVSDTERHRVLCFSLADGSFIAVYGIADKPGNALSQLDRPTTLAAREKRAVVFDSGNQRLLKLSLSEIR